MGRDPQGRSEARGGSSAATEYNRKIEQQLIVMPQIPDDEWERIQAEFVRLRGRAEIADFIEPIYQDPALNKEAKALIKKKYPHVQIADYDLEQKFDQRIDEVQKKYEDAEKKKADEEKSQKWQAERSKVQQEYGYTEDGMKDLEKFMWDNNVGSYEVAATYQVSKNPKQSDATQHDGRWHHQKQDGFADIAKDPESWAENEILGALRRDQERARGGR